MFDVVASNVLRIIGVAAEKEVSLEVFAKAGRYLVTRTVESGDSCQRMISTRSLSTETARLRFTFTEDKMRYFSGQLLYQSPRNAVPPSACRGARVRSRFNKKASLGQSYTYI